jgi:hypothetical protein
MRGRYLKGIHIHVLARRLGKAYFEILRNIFKMLSKIIVLLSSAGAAYAQAAAYAQCQCSVGNIMGCVR